MAFGPSDRSEVIELVGFDEHERGRDSEKGVNSRCMCFSSVHNTLLGIISGLLLCYALKFELKRCHVQYIYMYMYEDIAELLL